MLVTTTSEMVRRMGGIVRKADRRLVDAAARNAAASVYDHHARRLDEARTLHDLSQVTKQPVARPATETAQGQ